MAHPAVRVLVTLSHYVRWRSTTPSAGVSPRMVPRHERRSIGCADRSHPQKTGYRVDEADLVHDRRRNKRKGN
jgi:hypothetical protein